MTRQSGRSRPLYLPKFPRIQRMLKRREIDESLVQFVDSEFDIHMRPTRHIH